MVGLKVDSLDWANLMVAAVGAVGTIAALSVATLVGVHEARVFRREAAERDRDRRTQEEAQERAQAERVSAIARVNREPKQRYSIGSTAFQDEQVHYAYADVLNSSALPIYDAKVIYPHGDHMMGAIVGFVPGGEKGHVHLPPQPDATLDGSPLEVAFRDAGERWWARCPEGHLYRFDEDPYPAKDPPQAD